MFEHPRIAGQPRNCCPGGLQFTLDLNPPSASLLMPHTPPLFLSLSIPAPFLPETIFFFSFFLVSLHPYPCAFLFVHRAISLRLPPFLFLFYVRSRLRTSCVLVIVSSRFGAIASKSTLVTHVPCMRRGPRPVESRTESTNRSGKSFNDYI